jgi:tripartite-type tricarboxylate transporter receptor subunit TctC
MKRILQSVTAMMLVSAVGLWHGVALAQTYPHKPIRVIIPMAPGGSTDIIMRIIAPKLSKSLGSMVIVDNRGGAGGTIGMDMVAKAEPDGYTLLMTSPAFATNPLLHKVPFDPVKSFFPVAKIGNAPNVLVVGANLQVNSVKELIALAKKQPGKLACAAGGIGSSMHLASELFKMMAGVDFKIVQFKGGGPALVDAMGGHSQMVIGGLTQALPHIKSGKLKALGTSGLKRSKLLPHVPTIAEAGVPGYDASIWWGILAPAGTPGPVVDRLYKELTTILNTEDVGKVFEDQGAEVDLQGPTEFTQFLEGETAKWAKVVKQGNIKVD